MSSKRINNEQYFYILVHNKEESNKNIKNMLSKKQEAIIDFVRANQPVSANRLAHNFYMVTS